MIGWVSSKRRSLVDYYSSNSWAIVVVVVGKVIGARVLAVPRSVLRDKSFAGGVVLDLAYLAVTMLLCFVGIAGGGRARRMRKIDTTCRILSGYALSRGLLTTCATEEMWKLLFPLRLV
jgi:hypothetical protein